MQFLFGHANCAVFVLEQANLSLLAVQRTAKVTCIGGERVGGNGAWHVHFIYLCCRIEWQPLAGLETYLTDRVSSACVRPHFYCCFAYFYLSARDRERGGGKKCGLLIHVVSEKCYLLILLFKCKNAKRKLACHMPGVYQILRRPHTHKHTHKHSNTHSHTSARHSSAVAYT